MMALIGSTSAMADIHSKAEDQDPGRSDDTHGLLQSRRKVVLTVCRAVVINTPITRRMTRQGKCTACRMVSSAIIVLTVVIASIIISVANEENSDDSYASYTNDWTTNSDSSIPDKADITDDIDWSATKKPSTSNPHPSDSYVPNKADTIGDIDRSATKRPSKPIPRPAVSKWHIKPIIKNEVYTNWTQATTDCMDNMETPCSDIYQYTCGGWNAKTRIPDHFHHVDRFQEVTRNVTKIVKKYMNHHKRKTTEEKKAIKFYNHCNKFGRSDRQSVLTNLRDLLQRLSKRTLTSTSSSTDLEPLLADINKLNSWPLFQLLTRTTTENETVITISVGDLSINVEHIAEFFISGFKLSKEEMGRIKPKISILKRVYGNQDKYLSTSSASSLLMNHMTVNKLIFSKIWRVDSGYYEYYRPERNAAMKLAEDILSLELDLLLARIPGNVTKNSQNAREFSVWELQSKCGIYSWDKYFKELTSKTVSKVILLKPDVILKICGVISKYTGTNHVSSFPSYSEKKKLQNYILIRLIKDLMKYYGASILIDDEFYSTTLERKEKATKSEICFALTSNAFGMVIGNIYLKETNFATDKHRSKVASILRHVRERYRGLLLQSSWLDDETRTKAISKIDNLYVKLMYPPMLKDSSKLQTYYQKFQMRSRDWYHTVIEWMNVEFEKMIGSLSLPVDRSVWSIAPHEVNAVHTPWLNDITIPVGILQPPFFDESRPMAMNFGALGTIIGHEITHTFGDAGRHYNQYGQMEDWVTWKSQLHLQKTSKCFLDLYKSINHKFKTLIGNRTLEEDMSDNGGIKAAYGAYQAWKKKNVEHLNKETERWMKAEKLTLDELFIIAYSQMYCDKWNEDWLKNLSSRKHSPGLLRVKGPFETNEFMRSAFACRSSSLKQCNLW